MKKGTLRAGADADLVVFDHKGVEGCVKGTAKLLSQNRSLANYMGWGLTS